MPDGVDPRYLALNPRERETFDALMGTVNGRARPYDPTRVAPGGERITGDYYHRMREYYTREARRKAQRVDVRIHRPELAPRVFALGPGHIPKAICQTSSC